MNTPTSRPRATLDFTDFGNTKPKPKPKSDPVVKHEIAVAAGFTSRQNTTPKPKIDGRSLRATGRKEQLNIAVKPETKDEFWQAAQAAGFTRGEEFLLAMMEQWKKSI